MFISSRLVERIVFVPLEIVYSILGSVCVQVVSKRAKLDSEPLPRHECKHPHVDHIKGEDLNPVAFQLRIMGRAMIITGSDECRVEVRIGLRTWNELFVACIQKRRFP